MKLYRLFAPIILSFISLLVPVSAYATTYTYNNATGDSNWANTANWTSGIIPGITDDAIVNATTSTTTIVALNTGAPASVNSLVVNATTTASFSIPITVVTGATFNGQSLLYMGTTTGTTTFNGPSSNFNGRVVGNAIFNGNAYNSGSSIVTGNATFNGTSYNVGTVTGNMTYNTTAFATSTPANGTFIINNGTLGGTVKGTSYGSDGAPITNYIFNNNAINQSNITGTTTFNGNSYNQSTISGSAIFNTTHYASTTPANGTFPINAVSTFSGSILGTTYGSDLSPITTYVFGNNVSLNASTIITGAATFNNTSKLYGMINGNATFNNTSTFNTQGKVIGNVTFNDQTYLAGSITGNATFNTTHYASTTPSSGIFLLDGNTTTWYGNVSGTVYGSDMQPITAYVLTNQASISSTLTGNATFNSGAFIAYNMAGGTFGVLNGTADFHGTGSNFGTINGNATFRDTTANPGIVNGDVVFYNMSSNSGTIHGTAVFNDQSTNTGTVIPNTVPPTTAPAVLVTYSHSGGGGGGGGSGASHTVVPISTTSTTAITSTATTTTIAMTSSTTAFMFTKVLSLGQFSPDAHALQVFLNTHGFVVSPTGAGSPGNETFKFGLLTRYALKQFQNAHYNEILVPAGITVGTGVFGPATRTYINSLPL